MKKTAAFAALAALLTGCLAEGPSTVSVENIEYRELRIDGFSHYLLALRANAEEASDDEDTLYTEDGFVFVLLDKSLDKTASLPPHVVRTQGEWKRVYYPLEVEPKSLECLIKSKGSFATQLEAPEGRPIFMRVYGDLEGDEYYEEIVGLIPGYKENWRTGGACGLYFHGRGLFLDPLTAYGEIIVRY